MSFKAVLKNNCQTGREHVSFLVRHTGREHVSFLDPPRSFCSQFEFPTMPPPNQAVAQVGALIAQSIGHGHVDDLHIHPHSRKFRVPSASHPYLQCIVHLTGSDKRNSCTRHWLLSAQTALDATVQACACAEARAGSLNRVWSLNRLNYRTCLTLCLYHRRGPTWFRNGMFRTSQGI